MTATAFDLSHPALDVTIRKDDALPSYLQLAHAYRDAIHDGRFAPGDALPPERIIAERLGVSRVTVRKAIKQLVTEGKLRQRQGSGTYVNAQHRFPLSDDHRLSFEQELINAGKQPDQKILKNGTVPAEEDVAHRLGTRLSTKVQRIQRLRYADQEPVVLMTNFLAPHLPQVPTKLLDRHRSLYGTLHAIGSVAAYRAEQTMLARPANPHEEALLKLDVEEPVLVVERITYDQEDRPLDLVFSTFATSRYRPSLHLLNR